MKDLLLIYGAAGFTGGLVAAEAAAYGLNCVVAGRNRQKVEALARREGLPSRVAALDDRSALAALLKEAAVVVNAAGPFDETALPLARACIEHGAHYLDLAGEYSVIESLQKLDAEARQAGVMLLPAAGFDVVASDCLAALVSRRLKKPRRLSIALTGLNAISRGSAESVFRQFGDLVTVRREGRLQRVTPGVLTSEFDFGTGPTLAAAVTWADVVSAFHTTGIGDITVYYEATPMVRMGLSLNRYGAWLLKTPAWRWWQGAGTRLLPEGPSPAQRAQCRATVVARVEDASGRRVEGRLHTPEVYSFSATTSIAIAERVLAGDLTPGFQTPAKAYGPELVLSLPGVTYVEGAAPTDESDRVDANRAPLA